MSWSDAPGLLDGYFAQRIGFTNETGGRNWDGGTRILAVCPACGEMEKAWLNSISGWVKCFRASCDLNSGAWGLDLVRRQEGFRTRSEALVWLRREFPATGLFLPPAPPPPRYDDWCRLPQAFVPVPAAGTPYWTRTKPSHLLEEAVAFARRQWRLSVPDLVRWGVGYCTRGRYAWRLVIPVVLGGRLVAFQARTYRGGEPKYLTSAHGKQGDPGAECGRPAEALLFNLDAVREGSDVILVEGPGDVMRIMWWEGGSSVGGRGFSFRDRGGASDETVGSVSIALLGTALTDEKTALLAAKRPGRVIVALDRGAEREALTVAEKLAAWGLQTAIGVWVGGKDAGSGARLDVIGGGSLRDRVAGRLGR